MPGRQFTRRFSNASKRSTDWAFGVASTGLTNIPAASIVTLAAFPAASLSLFAPATIVRTRGRLLVTPDTNSAEESQIGAFGIGFVAPSVGTQAPGPISDNLWDGWFVYVPIINHFDLITAIGFAQSGAKDGYDIDSKAMRKFETDQTMVVVIENAHATQGFDIAINFRMLVKAG